MKLSANVESCKQLIAIFNVVKQFRWNGNHWNLTQLRDLEFEIRFKLKFTT
jgi:hypothetical protein